MKNNIAIAVFTALMSLAPVISTEASNSKDKLIEVMEQEQNAAEKKIIKMWMTKNRGKEFELLLSEYVTREVRYRAMTGKDEKLSLLAAVNAGKRDELTGSLELGRLLVLEYFKRKGVDLTDQRFVKGVYVIGLNENYEGVSETLD